MMLTRGATFFLMAVVAFGACGPKRDVVTLLPDPETNTTGRAVVSTPSGGLVELTEERQSTRVGVGQSPSDPASISETEVQRLFGDALEARPPAPRKFLLYFKTSSTQLTRESRRRLPQILDFVRNRSVPDLTVIGHTDTTHTVKFNMRLGWRRARIVRDQLVAVGIPAGLITVASHGESDLLVPTRNNTHEPKNRRVEVSVR